MIIGNIVTVGFLLAGAGVLRPQELAPQGAEVATTLVHLFSSKWGSLGGLIFMSTATIAVAGTVPAVPAITSTRNDQGKVMGI